MKIKFESAFRFYIFVLVALLVWSVWRASGQNETNSTEAAAVVAAAGSRANVSTNSPSGPPMPTPKWIETLTTRFPFLTETIWGNELWKYLFSLVYIFLAFYVSKFLDFATRVWLRKLADKTETKFDDMLLELLNGPIKIVAFVLFLRVGLSVFQWPALVQAYLAKGFTIIVAISLTYMTMKFIDLMMNYWRRRSQGDTDKAFDKQLFPIINKTLKVFVIVVATLVTLDNLGVNITAAIASLSIGGLAVGLAAQDTLANLFGAIAIYVDKPFFIGDAIQIDAATGTVEAIGLRSTRIRNADGHLIAVPNKTMGNTAITNISRRPNIRTEMNLNFTYNVPAEKVKRAVAILNEVYRGHAQTADLVVSFNKFTDSSLNVLVVHTWKGTDNNAYLAGIQELNLKAKERLDAEGISLGRSVQTHAVRQDSEWRIKLDDARISEDSKSPAS